MNSNIFKLSFLSLSLFFLFTLNSNAQITVDNLADGPANAGDCEIDAPPVGGNCSLRDAIEAANGNAGADEIIFNGGLALPGTITLTDGQMTITDDLTITGPGANMLTIDADDLSRIFLIDDGSDINVITVEIIGIAMINSFAQGDGEDNDGGAIFNRENLTIESCDFVDNVAGSSGGAINNVDIDAVLSIRNSLFDGNSAGRNGTSQSHSGGAIQNAVGTISEIVNTQFINNLVENTGNRGGAIFNFGLIRDIKGCLFMNNRTSLNIAGDGGAIHNVETIEQIIDTEFISNRAFNHGGAITTNGDIGLIDNCLFEGNSTSDIESIRLPGGGAINLGSDSTINEIRNSTFDDNNAFNGGAIYTEGSNQFFTTEITRIINSTFSRNEALQNGGAINFARASESSNIINCTFALNEHVNGAGGAIFLNDDNGFIDPINISFTTIVDNSSGLESNSNLESTFQIRNSVVANNGDSNDANCDANYTDLASETNNFSNDDSCGFDNGSNLSIVIGNLLDNGGPTDTIILGGDPIDNASADCDTLNAGGSATGVPLTTDQRSFTRPVGAACDAGAFENGAAPETVTINLTKVTNPEGGLGFDFTSTNFGALIGCMIDDTFTMDHNDTFTCDIPVGDYTIDEDIQGDQELQIVCNEGPANLIANNLTGETTFTVINPNDDINCVYINSSPDFLSLVTPEPEGANCEFGGVRVDTGFDDNFDGVLDPGEIDDTQFFCNTQLPPVIIPGPPQGDDDDDDDNNDDLESLVDLNVEPAGANCEFGGVRVDTGIDENGDGVLQANEIDDTNFICNDDPDNNNSNNSNNSSDSGCSIAKSGDDTNGLSLFSALLPFLMVPFVVFRRRKRK